MPDQIVCFRCGHSLAALTLPLSRRDLCPACSVELHVCKMCGHFDPGVVGQCREEDAEDVLDKEKANFCDWFGARVDAFDGDARAQAIQARSQLGALFGEGDDVVETDPGRSAAEDLFK